MPDTRDAYSQWLEIREPQRPLNHYQILGLKPYESNRQAIEQGFARQKARLAKHAQGDQARLGKRVLIELESARSCLLNPQTKATYDASLRVLEAKDEPLLATSPGEVQPLASLEPLDPFDPLNAQIAGLERVNSQLSQLPPAPPSAKATPPTARPTMQGYGYSTPPKRKTKEEAGLPRMVMGIGIGACAAVAIMAAGWLVIGGLGNNDAGPAGASNQEISQAETSETPEDATEAQPAQPVITGKVKNNRVLLTRPVTAGGASSSPPAKPRVSPDPPAERTAPAESQAATEPAQQPAPAATVPGLRPDPKAPPAVPGVRPGIPGVRPEPQANASSATGAASTPAKPATVQPTPSAVPGVRPGVPGVRPTVPGVRPSASQPGQSASVPPGAGPNSAAATWEDLPLAVDLPPLANGENIDKPIPLGELEVPDEAECKLVIVYGIEGEMPRYQFKLESAAEQPCVWRVAMFAKVESNSELAKEAEQPTEIARIELAEGQLQFCWLPGCLRVPADKLRNAVLWLHVGDKKQRLQLRTFISPAPLVLDLEENALNIPFNPATLPPLDLLQLELLEATSLNLASIQPPSRRVQGDDLLQLVVQQGPPGIEVRMHLKLIGTKANVRIEPSIVDVDGDTMSFTTTRINTMQRELPVDIRKAEAELADVRKRRADLEAELARLGDRIGSSGPTNIKVTSLRKAIENARNTERDHSARIPLLQRRLNVLPALANLGNQLHNKSQLRVRVFFVSGGEEVNLVWM